MQEFAQIEGVQGVSPGEKFVLITLAEYAGSFYGEPFAVLSKEALGRRTCMTSDQIDDAIRGLVAAGHVHLAEHPAFPGTSVAYLQHVL